MSKDNNGFDWDREGEDCEGEDCEIIGIPEETINAGRSSWEINFG